MRLVSRAPRTGSRPFTRRAGLGLGLGATAAGGAVLAACSSPSGGAPATGRAATTLEFWGGPSPAARQDQVNSWNAAHPEAQVHFSAVAAVGQGAAAQRTLAAALAANTAPHALDFDRFQVATYANWRAFRPLDDLLARDRIDVARFAPLAMQEAQGVDGRLYGLPSSLDLRLLYWNKERFAAAGLDPERPPATWDDLADAAVRASRSDGAGAPDRLGLDVGGGQTSLHLFAWQNGGGFQSPDGKTATLPLAPNGEALQWMVDLVRAQGGWEALDRQHRRWPGEDGPGHPFLTGELALQYQLPGWAGNILARYRPETAFGVAPPPRRRPADDDLTWSGGYSYVLNRDRPDAAATWAFLSWLLSEAGCRVALDGERERVRAAGGEFLPGLTGQPALDAAFLERYRTGRPALDAVPELALRLLARSRVRERSIAAFDLWEGVIGAQTDALTGQAEPQPALEQHNARVQRALDQAWVFTPGRDGGR